MKPEGWREVQLQEVMSRFALTKLFKEHKAGKLTQSRIREICEDDADHLKANGIDPLFLVYALMNNFGVYE